MSGDSEQEYFVDGMVEEIITALSKVRWFFVIARNSTFTYKGRAIDVKQVGRELGVRYVLEGSVRKSGSRIRVTAQLVEAETGNHVWAERGNRALSRPRSPRQRGWQRHSPRRRPSYVRVDGVATECGMARGDPTRFPELLAAHAKTRQRGNSGSWP